MKILILLLLLVSNLSLFSQSETVIGDYYRKLGSGDHIDEYFLTLKQDGTFLFHSYRKAKYGIPPEINTYGKGNWTAEVKRKFSTEGITVSFFTEKEKDFDDTYTLDFNNSKARFLTKSPRDKTDKVIKESLRFFASDIFWMEKIDMFKE